MRVPVLPIPRVSTGKCYSMGFREDGKDFPNSYVSELVEFTDRQKEDLLKGEEVRVEESPERWVYICDLDSEYLL